MPSMNRHLSSWLVASVLGLVLVCACSHAQKPVPNDTETAANPAVAEPGTDWPIFLGPEGTGVSTEAGLLDEWPAEGPPVVWDKKLGTGYAAPSVIGGKLVVHHRVDDEEVVACVDALDGSDVWEYRYSSNFSDPYGYNNGPRCSPLLTTDHCYTLGAAGKLLCVTLADGKLVWEHNLHEEFNIPEGFFGIGATPVLEGNKLLVLVGGQPNSGVVAFDSQTGKKLWENVGKSTWNGAETGWEEEPTHEWDDEEMVVSYSSPIVATIHNQRHLLCLMRQGLVSVNPETGEENFHYWFRSRTHESVNAARPVVVGDTILLSAAYKMGSALLKVQPDGKHFDVVWRDPDNLLTHWSTAIHLDGHYFGFSGRHENEGMLRCIDAKDGHVVWESDGWMKPTTNLGQTQDGRVLDRETKQEIPFPYYGRGSAILAEGKFIVLAERGTLALVEASTSGWKEISRCKAPRMHYPSWAAPILSRGRLYLRCEDALVCLDMRKPQ